MTEKQTTRQVQLRKAKTRHPSTLRSSTLDTPETFHVLVQGMRPASGPRLYAHTIAALEVLGLFISSKASRRTVVPSARLQAFIGPRAFDYHTRTAANMKVVPTGVQLTATGHEFFTARVTDGRAPAELIDAFVSVFRTGKPNETAQVKAHHIAATTI